MNVNPFLADPNFVRASYVEETEKPLRLFKFPDGFHFYLHSNSTRDEAEIIYNEVMVKREYLPPEIQLDETSCVFDVGANVGGFTLSIKSMCPRATVYAFEPIPETFSVLQSNIALHSLQDVIAHNVAIGDCDFDKKNYTYYVHLPSSSTSDPSTKEIFRNLMNELIGKEQTDQFMEHVTRPTTVRTLSSIISEHNIDKIDLLKIDVEGDECTVLSGIKPEHYDLIRQVSMEVHSHEHLACVNKLLEKMGFTHFQGQGILASSESDVIHVFAIR